MFFRIIIGVGVVLVGLFAWTYYKVSTYQGTHSSHRIEVARERPLVWHYLTESVYRELWMANLDELTAIGGIPGEIGEQTLVTLEVDGVPYEYVEEVTAIDPPTFLQFTQEARGYKGMIEYDLRRQEDGGTLLMIERDITYQTVLAIALEPWFERTARQNIEQGLEKLKRLAESAPANENFGDEGAY